jgi:hypothetical protein
MPFNFAARDAVRLVSAIGLLCGYRDIVPAASLYGPALAVPSIEITAARTKGGADCGWRDVARGHAADEPTGHCSGSLRILLHRSTKLADMFARGQAETEIAQYCHDSLPHPESPCRG